MNKEKGWIPIHREAFSNLDPFWSEKRKLSRFEAWLDLQQKAAYAAHTMIWRGSAIELRPGDVPMSERGLAEDWRWSRQRVRSFLHTLEQIGRATRREDQGITILTVAHITTSGALSTTNRTAEQTRDQTAEQTELSPLIDQPEEREERKKEEKTSVNHSSFPSLGKLPKPGGRYDYPDPFEGFWNAYPVKGHHSKTDAYQAWRACLARNPDASPKSLTDGASRYAAYVESEGTPDKFVIHPKTVLGPSDKWRDPWSTMDRDSGVDPEAYVEEFDKIVEASRE